MDSLNNFSDEQLEQELKKRQTERKNANHVDNLEPKGWWEVTAEGKSTKHLGTHYGHIVDIARKFSGEALFGLRFSKPNKPEKTKLKPQREKVTILLDVQSKTWDMPSRKRVDKIEQMLNKSESDTAYQIDESRYYGSVTLCFGPDGNVDRNVIEDDHVQQPDRGSVKKIKIQGEHWAYLETEQKKQQLWDELIEWCQEHNVFDGEGSMQDDDFAINAPYFIASVVDRIVQFKTEDVYGIQNN